MIFLCSVVVTLFLGIKCSGLCQSFILFMSVTFMFCVFYLHAMYQSLCSVTVTIMVRVSYFYVLHQVLLGFVSSQLLFCFVSVTFLFRVSYFYASCQLLLLVASRLFYLSCDHLLIVCWLHFIQLSVTSML